MPTSLNKYLDPAALDETVVNIRELIESLEAEMQDLPYARPDGIYPDMTVGAVIGADSTAQWATRESTGSGAATVRSVQGAAEVQDDELVPVHIAGMRSTGFNLLNVQRDVVITNANAAEYSDGSNRKFAENQMWVGMTMSNIMSSSAISSYEVGEEAVTITSTNSGYGIAFPVQAIPNAQYYIGSESSSDALFGIGLYDAAGVFIAFRPASGAAAVGFVFSTTEDTHWLTVCMRPTRDVTTTYNRPILNLSDTERNGTYEPYHIVDAIEWPTQTLRAAGSVRDELTADELVTRVGVVDLGTLNWERYEVTAGSGIYAFESTAFAVPFAAGVTNFKTALYPCVGNNRDLLAYTDKAMTPWNSSTTQYFGIRDDAYADAAAFKAVMSGVLLYYELATPTTTPISPALPMTYRVQAGGSESVIVPTGEVSAAPVLTVAESVNAGDEFARIWAAIQSLGYTRNAAQLSRPVSLTDIGSIDEAQKDTTEIDTTKEVTK